MEHVVGRSNLCLQPCKERGRIHWLSRKVYWCSMRAGGGAVSSTQRKARINLPVFLNKILCQCNKAKVFYPILDLKCNANRSNINRACIRKYGRTDGRTLSVPEKASCPLKLQPFIIYVLTYIDKGLEQNSSWFDYLQW